MSLPIFSPAAARLSRLMLSRQKVQRRLGYTARRHHRSGGGRIVSRFVKPELHIRGVESCNSKLWQVRSSFLRQSTKR